MAEPLVSTRLNRRLARELDHLAAERGQARSALLRDLIEQGLRTARIDDAVEAYREGRVSSWRAAEVAGLSTWEFLDLLKARRVSLPLAYGRAEAEEDLAQATADP